MSPSKWWRTTKVGFTAKKLDEGQLIAGADLQGTVPMWNWIGDESATTFSY